MNKDEEDETFAHIIHIIHSSLVKNLSHFCSHCKRPFFGGLEQLYTLSIFAVDNVVDIVDQTVQMHIYCYFALIRS